MQSWSDCFHKCHHKNSCHEAPGQNIPFCNNPGLSGQQTAFDKRKLGVELNDVRVLVLMLDQ